MNDKLTYQEMWELFKMNLYTFSSETELATPDYRYCKRDAPVYRWQNDKEYPFVKVVTTQVIETENELRTELERRDDAAQDARWARGW